MNVTLETKFVGDDLCLERWEREKHLELQKQKEMHENPVGHRQREATLTSGTSAGKMQERGRTEGSGRRQVVGGDIPEKEKGTGTSGP
jgi:hypothetical protein